MLNPRRQAQCACRLGSTVPGTLDELAQQVPVTLLGQDIETLALLGTQLEDALITTRNSAAVISAKGGHGRLQTADSAFSIRARRANLRYSASAPLQLARSAPEPLLDLPGSLVAVDHAGEVQHRVQVTSEYDCQVAAALDAGAAMAFPPPAARPAGNVVSLAAVRQARDRWDRGSAEHHLNDFLHDRGRARLRTLHHLGGSRAWQVQPRALPEFIGYLQARRRAFTRIVCATGLMQAQAGEISRIALQDEVMFCEAADTSFALDLKQVGAIWVAAALLHWQLEIYDTSGAAVAVLAAVPMSCGRDWRDWLLAMPRA